MLTFHSLTVQEQYYRAARAVAAVLVRVCRGSCPEPLLDRVRARLEILPLPTAAFALAVRRLDNARTYLRAGESGAAAFELRLLLTSLAAGK
jgi:hypothetical protein